MTDYTERRLNDVQAEAERQISSAKYGCLSIVVVLMGLAIWLVGG